MSVPNGGETVVHGAATGEDTAREDVVISIKGTTAARMLARGEAEAAKRDEMMRALDEQLQRIEAALAERVSEQGRLDRDMQGLHSRLSSLGEELAQLRTALGSIPDQLSTQHVTLGALQERIHQLGSIEQKVTQLGLLQQKLDGRLGALEWKVDGQQGDVLARINGLSMSVDALREDGARLLERVAALENPPPGILGTAADRIKLTADRLKKLHLGGLWAVLLALALTVAGTAVWATAP